VRVCQFRHYRKAAEFTEYAIETIDWLRKAVKSGIHPANSPRRIPTNAPQIQADTQDNHRSLQIPGFYDSESTQTGEIQLRGKSGDSNLVLMV
jgi:hypothetical protein